MHVLWRIVVKEFQQLRRDRRMIPLVLLAPALQLIALGYAANLDVTGIPLVVVDEDRSRSSRDLVERFTASGYFALAGAEDTASAVEHWLVSGRGQIALVIPPGFGEQAARGRAPSVQVLADGSDSTAAGIGLGYARGIVSGSRAPARIEAIPRVFYNPDLKSRWFFVPAVLAMVLMVMTMVLASMGVVREKEIGTMEQLMVTPVRPWQLIVGKLLPFALIGLLDAVIVTALTVLWFGVPLRGSAPLLLGLTMLFLLNTLGLGLLVSTLVRTQQQAMMTAALLFMVPMIYLSGIIFPVENMPRAIRAVTYVIPLRYYARILRGIFLKGAGLDILWPEALSLLALGATFLVLASARFRKRLD